MRRAFFTFVFIPVILPFLCVPGIAKETETVQFRLEGTHSFKIAGAQRWEVDREERDEKTGTVEVFRNVAKANGQKAEFRLAKSENKITTFHISAIGRSFSKKFRVTVFAANKISSFYYKQEGIADVRTYILVPSTLSAKSRALMVMHGRGRNADDYIASWEEWGTRNDYIILCPEFENVNWKGSRSYNLGNVFSGKSGFSGLNDRSKWSYMVVENIFTMVKDGFDLLRDDFDMFGHSAGGQFVHRFALFMPTSKFRVAIAANSGWYTLPDLTLDFPYGLKHAELIFTKDDLAEWSRRHLFILRGTEDTERTPGLRQTPEADTQGKTRYGRAAYMFEKIQSINPKTNWRLVDVPGVGHEQKGMAPAAQKVLNEINAKRR